MRSLTLLLTAALLGLGGCGAIYHSPSVNPVSQQDGKVRVVPVTAETVMVANRGGTRPQTLPAVFQATAGGGRGLRGAGAVPEPALEARQRPPQMETRLPPDEPAGPYTIGVGDVLLLATPQMGDTVEQLSGLLAAQNARQGYTVQDDGTIAIPNVGRVQVGGLTMEEAETLLFQRLLENQIDPTFSLEIAEFNSKKVSIGGAVARPSVAPITLTPLYLDEALAAAGGITAEDPAYASIRIYRDGTLYQIPLEDFYAEQSLDRVQLRAGDSIFVDNTYDLTLARAYFEEQIRLSEFRQNARIAALNELNAEVSLRRAELGEARENFLARLDLDAVDRDFVYMTGEVSRQTRYPLPFGRTASLADALYDNGGMPTETADARQIYVLRGSADPREFAAVTAWQLDVSQATNLLLATRFELRPDDVIFVAEQPVTRWGRVIDQITPSLLTSAANAAN